MRIFILIALFFITLFANEKVSLQLQWFDQFQFAGYYVAKEKGYYRDVGLDVDIKKYKIGLDVAKEVTSGRATFGIGRTSLLIDESRDDNIILMSAIFQSSPLVLIAKKSSNLNIIENFKHKRAIVAGTEDSAGTFAMLSSRGISRKDMDIIESKNKLQDFIDGKADIISAYTSNQVHILRQKGIDINVFNPKDYGFDFYSDLLFTSKKEYILKPQVVINFKKASLKGWEYAFSHIGETVKLIEKKYNSQHKTDEQLFFEALNLKELAYKGTDRLGNIDKNKIKQIYDIYRIMGFIKKDIDFNDIILEKDKSKVYLNKKEKSWIKKHPIVTYSEVNWKPLSIIKDGKMGGIFGDFLDLISKKTGLKFRYIHSDTWSGVVEKFKKQKIDMIPSNPQISDSDLGLVSKVYKTYPMVIVSSDKYKYVSSMEELTKQTIAVPKYYTSYFYLRKNYPHIKLKVTRDIPEALSLVEEGKADAFVGHIATAIYYISTLHFANLKIAGTTNFKFKHSYLVQKKYPQLLSIINKAFMSITLEERAKIYSKWSSVTVKEMDYRIIFKILIVGFILFLFLLYRNKKLKKYNEEIKKLKERLELALKGNNEGVWDRDLQKDILYLSPRWKAILGYKDSDIKSETDAWRDRVHPDDLPRALKDIKDHLEGKTEFYENEHRIKHKDGHWIWVLDKGKKILDESGKAVRMIGTHVDITAKKELRLRLERQKQIIEQIHDCVILADLDGYIMSWNRGAEVLLGYTKDEAIGCHIDIFYKGRYSSSTKKVVKILRKKEKLDMELELVTKSKKKIFSQSSISVFRDESGHISGIVGYIRDITRRKEVERELKKQEEILWRQANYDLLTGLPNRSLFKDRLEHSIENGKRHGVKFALFFLDLDRFKQINDSLGHEVGDIVLKKVSSLIKSILRKEDTLARLGGDEFVIVTGSISKVADVGHLADKIINVLKEPIIIDEHNLYLSVSIGISLFPDDSKDMRNLLKFADSAMYKAKDEGRDNYQFYSPDMTKLAFERVAMETHLRLAIKNREFIVYYQPQFNALSEEIVGVEALVRWAHPTMGLIAPSRFIPLAEDTGMIADIDKIVIEQAMKQVDKWRKRGLDPGTLALNLSIGHLSDKNLINFIQKNISLYKIDAKSLELEVTESKVMKKPEEMIAKLKTLSDMGIKIAIDDFGTGYSSLSYLKRLPIDILKIDQSFVRHVPLSDDDSSIVKSIIALGQSLDLTLLAEGVETLEQKNFIIENGCKIIQGYYFSKPLNHIDMEKLLSKKQI